MNFFPALTLLLESLPAGAVVRAEPGQVQIEVSETAPALIPAQLLRASKRAAALQREDLFHLRELLEITSVAGRGAAAESASFLVERFRCVIRQNMRRRPARRRLAKHFWQRYERLFKALGYRISSNASALHFTHHFARYGITVRFPNPFSPDRVEVEARALPEQILRDRSAPLLRELFWPGPPLYPWQVVGFMPVCSGGSAEDNAFLPTAVRTCWRRTLKAWFSLTLATCETLQAQITFRTEAPEDAEVTLTKACSRPGPWRLVLRPAHFPGLTAATRELRLEAATLPVDFEMLQPLVEKMGQPSLQSLHRHKESWFITFWTAPAREVRLETEELEETEKFQRWDVFIQGGGCISSSRTGLTLPQLEAYLLREPQTWRRHGHFLPAFAETLRTEGSQGKLLRQYLQADGKGLCRGLWPKRVRRNAWK